ncbi:MAG TPA: hypothetical protein VFT53_06310 [Candidatus Saccharimonadales bacterium]|nr:hypothetical protein [Candidatus Saccharimonadales bacterium]
MEYPTEFPTFEIVEPLQTIPTLGSTVAQKSVIMLGGRIVNAFVKSGVTPVAVEKIRNQSTSQEALNLIGTKGKPSFRAPDVYGLNPNGDLATEWIDTEPLSEVKDVQYTGRVLGRILATFDKYAERSISPPQFGLRETHDAYVTSLRERIWNRLDLGHINKGEAALYCRSIERLNAAYESLASVVQHGDLRPDHIYPDPTDKCGYVIIDSELMRGIWPRFYDLGKSLARYAITHPNPTLGTAVLQEFLAASGADPEVVLLSLKGILAARALAFGLFPIHDLRPVSRRMAANFRKRSNVLLESLSTVNDMQHLVWLINATANRTDLESEIADTAYHFSERLTLRMLDSVRPGYQRFRESEPCNVL